MRLGKITDPLLTLDFVAGCDIVLHLLFGSDTPRPANGSKVKGTINACKFSAKTRRAGMPAAIRGSSGDRVANEAQE
jgi:hypothetical protein